MTLKYLDTTIAFAVVMLLLSMLVMVLVQAVASSLNLRGRNLIEGLETLLKQISPMLSSLGDEADKKSGTFARQIAVAVAIHPTVAAWSKVGAGYAQAISKTELLHVLSAIDTDPQGSFSRLSVEARSRLKTLFGSQDGGQSAVAPEAQSTLMDPANKSMDQSERSTHPASTGLGAASNVAAGIDKWFDTVMSRTSDWYKSKTRMFTVLLSFALAFMLRVDTLDVFHQLSTDPELRAQLVQKSTELQDRYTELNKAMPAQGHATPAELVKTLQDNRTALDGAQDTFKRAQLKLVADPPSDLRTFLAWYRGMHLVGTFLTALFLSLGAPFWFNTLQQLSSLRPAVAGKVGSEGKDTVRVRK